ncbi:MAG: TadG family pilus assembly protein [Pararobbsia sp.]
MVTAARSQSPAGRYNLNTKSLVAGSTPYNAVNVALNKDVDFWFLPLFNAKSGSDVNVVAQSTARAVNVGAFTLATGLAAVNTGNSQVLNGLLGGLLGTTLKSPGTRLHDARQCPDQAR